MDVTNTVGIYCDLAKETWENGLNTNWWLNGI